MRRGKVLRGRLASRALSWVLALALCTSPAAPFGAVAWAQAASIDADELGRLLEALAEERSTLPRDRFDVLEALELTDFTPESAFAWVRDATRLVPYRGALRGPLGVLLDREGNSLDRALLLQDMFDALGYDTRIVGTTLDPATGASLLEAVRARSWERDQGAGGPALSPESVADDLSARYGVDRQVVLEATSAATQREESLRTELDARTERQAGTLLDLLGDVLPAPTGEAASAHEQALLAALADHWWLQYDEAGEWVDLDPSLPAHEVGDALGEPSVTLDAFGIVELPAELQHRVTIALVLECVEDGTLVEKPLLLLDPLLPAELLDKRVTVAILPAGLTEEEAADPASLAAALLEEQHWYPAVSVGETGYTDLEFSPACETTAFTPPWGIGGAVRDVLGGAGGALFGGGPAPDAVTALRLRLTLESPGTDPTVVERDLVDVIGSARRAAGDLVPSADEADRLAWRLRLLGEREVLVTAGGLHQDYLSYQATSAVLEAGPGLAASLGGEEPEAPASVTYAPGALHALAQVRQRYLPATLYQGAPSVYVRHHWYELASDGSPVANQALDVVKDDLMSYAGLAAAARDRLRLGVALTNAEALLAAQLCADAATEEFCAVTGNAGELLAAVDDPGSWVLVTEPSEADAVLPGWTPDALARLRADVSAGHVALAPREPLAGQPVAWWRVDTASGSVLGVDELGYGNAAFEYLALTNAVSFAFCMKSAASSAAPGSGAILCGLGLGVGIGGVILTGTISAALGLLAAILYGLGS